jgi:hypothetical protein
MEGFPAKCAVPVAVPEAVLTEDYSVSRGRVFDGFRGIRSRGQYRWQIEEPFADGTIDTTFDLRALLTSVGIAPRTMIQAWGA